MRTAARSIHRFVLVETAHISIGAFGVGAVTVFEVAHVKQHAKLDNHNFSFMHIPPMHDIGEVMILASSIEY